MFIFLHRATGIYNTLGLSKFTKNHKKFISVQNVKSILHVRLHIPTAPCQLPTWCVVQNTLRYPGTSKQNQSQNLHFP